MTTRVPIDDSCKTRLSPLLSRKKRQLLQKSMIQDELANIKKAGLPALVFITPSSAEEEMRAIAGAEVPVFPQTGNDLGEMMRNAFSAAFDMGYSPCILIGSDIPELDAAHLLEAFDLLKSHDVALTPTPDGGYCLIGMKELHEEAFGKMEYGKDTVLEKTIAMLKSGKHSVGLSKSANDIDTPKDLTEFARKNLPHCPITNNTIAEFDLAAQDSISIVIPAYNEEAILETLLDQLEPIRNDCEIIFVDGGSSDATVRIIESAGYPCLQGKGRGNQLNIGARHAHGDILFFLHCDSIIPADPLGQIREVLAHDKAGFFGVKFNTDEWVMGVCGRQSNRRAKYRQIPFGDQGIFLKRDLFWEVGGYPEIPLMEDYEFSLGLRKRGIHFGQTRNPIITSARKYGKGFFHQLKVMYQMHELRYRYRHGCTPEELRDMYKKI